MARSVAQTGRPTALSANWSGRPANGTGALSRCPGVGVSASVRMLISVGSVLNTKWRLSSPLLGMFSATGSFRATNKGSCIQDYFRCRKLSRQQGLEGLVAKECCLDRFVQFTTHEIDELSTYFPSDLASAWTLWNRSLGPTESHKTESHKKT